MDIHRQANVAGGAKEICREFFGALVVTEVADPEDAGAPLFLFWWCEELDVGGFVENVDALRPAGLSVLAVRTYRTD